MRRLIFAFAFVSLPFAGVLQKAFSCKADAPMMRQNQCRVW